MKLKKLLKDLPVDVKGGKELDIAGLCDDSKLASPGDLFVAKRGGVRFIEDALRGGATAVLTDIYNPFHKVTQIITKEMALVEQALAERMYPGVEPLFKVGVTGTNGKTTTTYLIRHLLGSCGLIGTVETIVGCHHLPSKLTTPDLIYTRKLLQEMSKVKETAVAMEVSSHALDQGRVRGLLFDVGLFTNFSQDHLDYHKDMASYKQAKEKLALQSKIVVYNADNPFNVKGLSYSIEAPSDFQAQDLQLSAAGLAFSLRGVRFETSLIGRFNVYNCLAAIVTATQYGLSLEQCALRLKQFKGVPGRLERVPHKGGVNVFVDFAHTDDALTNVLKALQEIKTGRLITVFGCGGDRDREKRPKMGKAAEALSDELVVTSDNPRSEDPQAICQEIVAGLTGRVPCRVQVERRQAIHGAIQAARAGDIVLIAGKGHETKQIIGGRTIDFDDRKVALEV